MSFWKDQNEGMKNVDDTHLTTPNEAKDMMPTTEKVVMYKLNKSISEGHAEKMYQQESIWIYKRLEHYASMLALLREMQGSMTPFIGHEDYPERVRALLATLGRKKSVN